MLCLLCLLNILKMFPIQLKRLQYKIKFKFQQQGRFMFGVCMVELVDGRVVGRRMPMYTYSGLKILGEHSDYLQTLNF